MTRQTASNSSKSGQPTDIRLPNGKAITEASGRITAATAKAIAATGVDLISAGWITHSSAALDIGLDYLDLKRQAA